MVETKHETRREKKVWPDTPQPHVSDDGVLDLLVAYLDKCKASLTEPDFELICTMCQHEQSSMEFYLEKNVELKGACAANDLVEDVRKFKRILNKDASKEELKFCNDYFDHDGKKSNK